MNEPCPACGTWTCDECGWKRARAALARPDLQKCPKCGGTKGTLTPTVHQNPIVTEDHAQDMKRREESK